MSRLVACTLLPALPAGLAVLLSAGPVRAECKPRTAEGGGNRFALVIGNERYDVPPADAPNQPPSTYRRLPNAASDARDVGLALQRFGFKVVVCEDLSTRGMTNALHDHAVAVSTSKGAVSLFYYAGHGALVDRSKNMLHGVQYRSTPSWRAEGLEVEKVVSTLEPAALDVQHAASIVIIDACRTALEVRGPGEVQVPVLAPFATPTGSYVVFSTGHNRNAEDSTSQDPKHSAFAGQFLAALAQKDHAKLEIDLFFRQVRKNVKTVTGDRQVPWTSHSLLEDLTFQG